MPRNDKTFLSLHKYLLDLNYSNEWEENTENKYIKKILEHSSKNKNGNIGLPDYLYVNEKKRLLIMIELKSTISKHEKEAIPEIKHYLSCFIPRTLETYGVYDTDVNNALNELKKWNILGIAISGDIEVEYSYRIDTFGIKIDTIEDMNINEIHNEDDYLALFENLNLEEISTRISQASSRINNLLYSVKEDKRPTLLSILLISLYESKNINNVNIFREQFEKYTPKQLMKQIGIVVPEILGEDGENLPIEKIEMIMREFNTFENEKDLLETDTIKTILTILKNNVIPLFDTRNNYDIIGKFYQEFLRYAGIVDVQSGIILTPEHISELFTNLVDMKKDDVIFDSCCGTGSFLIAAMNRLMELQTDNAGKENVRKKQLIGNELKSHMYILAISNMLFRGDGKSNILNYDFFSPEFDREFKKKECELNIKPTIGFINPPYSGSFTNYKELQDFKSNNNSNSKNKKPWMKEISFLEKMCKICSRYVVMIAPPQTFMSESDIRDNLLKENTLKAIINMPKDLFEPNASTGSSIIVIETNRPHDFSQCVDLYNLKSDGFELAKKKGRRDLYKKWNGIKKKMLKDIDAPWYRNPQNVNDITHCYVKIRKKDEWLIQAFSKVEFDKIDKSDFEETIKEFIIFNTKKDLELLDKELNEIELLEILQENTVSAKDIIGDEND